MEWISIKEDHPKLMEDILVTDEKKVCWGWRENDHGEDLSIYTPALMQDGSNWSDNITHWMPLPKPPEKDGS